jgi:hypothetical protein
MSIKDAGERARDGFWFNLKTWEFHLHRTDGEMLPGGPGDRYLRIPTAALLLVGPAMGLLYVVVVPVIGFALALREIGHSAVVRLRRPGRRTAGGSAPRRP